MQKLSLKYTVGKPDGSGYLFYAVSDGDATITFYTDENHNGRFVRLYDGRMKKVQEDFSMSSGARTARAQLRRIFEIEAKNFSGFKAYLKKAGLPSSPEMMTLIQADDPALLEALEQSNYTLPKPFNPQSNLAKMRHQAGFSQSRLSIEARVPHSTLARWESRDRSINGAAAGTLRRIAKVLGCSIEELLEDD